MDAQLRAGSLLKEAIEDLEWVAASGSVSLSINRQPPNVTLSAYSAGSLQVKIEVSLPRNQAFERQLVLLHADGGALLEGSSDVWRCLLSRHLVQGDDLQGIHCQESVVSHRYKYKHLRAMVANLPLAKDATAQTSTKVNLLGHWISTQYDRHLGTLASTHSTCLSLGANKQLNKGLPTSDLPDLASH